jgi:hypothetical protein
VIVCLSEISSHMTRVSHVKITTYYVETLLGMMHRKI